MWEFPQFTGIIRHDRMRQLQQMPGVCESYSQTITLSNVAARLLFNKFLNFTRSETGKRPPKTQVTGCNPRDPSHHTTKTTKARRRGGQKKAQARTFQRQGGAQVTGDQERQLLTPPGAVHPRCADYRTQGPKSQRADPRPFRQRAPILPRRTGPHRELPSMDRLSSCSLPLLLAMGRLLCLFTLLLAMDTLLCLFTLLLAMGKLLSLCFQRPFCSVVFLSCCCAWLTVVGLFLSRFIGWRPKTGRFLSWYSSNAPREPGGDFRRETQSYIPAELDEVKIEDSGEVKTGDTSCWTQPDGRCRPLINQGATCYLNSILQVLFMTPELLSRLDPSRDLDRELTAIWRDQSEAPCGTEKITEILEIESVHQQRDAAECLERVLSKVSPDASQVFQGQLRETTKCSEGHVIIEDTSPFFFLPLSLQVGHDENCSVETSFNEHFQSTEHTGDNMVHCNDCKQRTEGTSGCEMQDFPSIMTLLLKRFYYDFSTESDAKSHCSVDVPFTIQAQNTSYSLYGMVDHRGSLQGGHYTATVLNRDDNTWYCCDDTRVTEVKEQLFASRENHSSRTAYLLMYRASGSHRR